MNNKKCRNKYLNKILLYKRQLGSSKQQRRIIRNYKEKTKHYKTNVRFSNRIIIDKQRYSNRLIKRIMS